MSRGLLRSAGVFSLMTLISRISGLVRDQVYATSFGASPAMDAFLVAFRIPNFMRRISAEGSFSMAFIPVLQDYRAHATPAQVKDLIDRVAGTMCAFLLILSAIAIAFAPWILRVFAPGFVPGSEQFELAAEMLRITFPYLLFISLASLAGGVLNSYGRFAVPALSPVLLNLTLIFAALAIAPRLQVPVRALAWGVFAAGALQLAFQLPFLARLGLLPRPKWGGADPGVRQVLRLMGPTLLGSSVAQVNLLLNTVFATSLMAGSVTWLYYTDRLLEFPLGMFGVAIGTVILPHLAKQHAFGKQQAYSQGLDWGFRMVLLIAVPAALGLMLCAQALVATLFMYGQFSAEDARMTSLSLVMQATAVPAFLLVKVLAPAFYARKDTRTPVRAALHSMAANVLVVIAAIAAVLQFSPAGIAAMAQANGDPLLAIRSVHGLHAALAVAIAAAGWVNALLLWRYLRKAQVYQAAPGWGLYLLRIALAAAVMVLVVGSLALRWDQWQGLHFAERAIRLACMVAAGGASYLGSLYLLGVRPAVFRGQ